MEYAKQIMKYGKQISVDRVWFTKDKSSTDQSVIHDMMSMGIPEADIEVGVATKGELEAWNDEKFAYLKPMEDWKQKMAESDGSLMLRDLEDLVTINNFTMTSEMKIRYDAKASSLYLCLAHGITRPDNVFTF